MSIKNIIFDFGGVIFESIGTRAQDFILEQSGGNCAKDLDYLAIFSQAEVINLQKESGNLYDKVEFWNFAIKFFNLQNSVAEIMEYVAKPKIIKQTQDFIIKNQYQYHFYFLTNNSDKMLKN